MRLAGALLVIAALSGCIVAAAVVVAAAVGVGAYLYVENELSYEYEASLDAAWGAAVGAAGDLSLKREEEKKDFQSGTMASHMSDGRNVRILCEKLGEKRTRVRVRVGDFQGEANRQASQTIHETIARRMGLKAPPLPPPEGVAKDEIQRAYRAAPEACYEGCLKAAGKVGHTAEKVEFKKDGTGSISARSGEKHLYVSLSAHGNGTRVVVQSRGPGGADDLKKLARAFHEALGKELNEEGKDPD
jgi:hypothetical protein